MIKVSALSRKTGFTLIELLIVVAIIAILAAIAVPNFLEAQTRSKVSRVAADQRSLSTGIEAYWVDNNKMFPTARAVGQTRKFIWGYITTPIAYMTSVPQDPFNTDGPVDDAVIVIWGPDYLYGNTTVRFRDGQQVVIPDVEARGATLMDAFPGVVASPYSGNGGGDILRDSLYVMLSWGPDREFDAVTPSFPSPVFPYDPSNGTISKGDVVRLRN